ncbi:MAG: 3-deoxy-manno-octulosonate cytidylyltransferase [Ignavibacteria bacterium]|jgi:3-deoxy-manno-octulosonate cytidylyltransferase (CMP-KDO synthetase)|nr:3-deoxy-manno-octulosonate cytidylyltransferase [Ignavibacteria bacterium]MDH7528568.1 3-deoxy-manno-octulosonate cytidylyltransferase [Ignavibacteria bacterium]
MSKILGLIPARFASTRLFGKPLRFIGNKPMIQHTYESALKSIYLDKLVVLTDDVRIFNAVKSFGGEVEITPQDLQSGTDRCAYYSEKFPEYDIVVNIQGDEPFIHREVIDKTIKPLLQIEEIQVATAGTYFKDPNLVPNPSLPKVVLDENGFAVYFSRSVIPYYQSEEFEKRYIRHIGIYVYRREALLKITKLPQTRLERIEKLEQLRMIENGFKIKVELVDYEPISVDTEEDLIYANNYWKEKYGIKE